ncbi:transposase, partial [candidate division KSB1 bacterium]
MNFIIGLDAHSKHCEFAVYNKNKRLVECKRIDTTEEDLTEYVRGFKNPKIIIFEESTMAQWLYTIFLPYFDDVIVSEPRVNYLINKSEQKNDSIDSKNLVKLYLNNSIQRVYHTDSDILELKRLVIQYHSHVKDCTRKKNQIKAKYRENGILADTSKVYSKKHYKEFLDNIESSSSRFIIMSLMRSLYRSKREADRIKKVMIRMSKRYKIIKEFLKIP